MSIGLSAQMLDGAESLSPNWEIRKNFCTSDECAYNSCFFGITGEEIQGKAKQWGVPQKTNLQDDSHSIFLDRPGSWAGG